MGLNITIHHRHVHHYPEIEAMNEALENIRREVAETKTAQQSAVALITGIAASLAEAAAKANDLEAFKAEVNALSTDLSDSTDSLAGAVTANTPAADEPVDPVDPVDPAPVDADAPVGDAGNADTNDA